LVGGASIRHGQRKTLKAGQQQQGETGGQKHRSDDDRWTKEPDGVPGLRALRQIMTSVGNAGFGNVAVASKHFPEDGRPTLPQAVQIATGDRAPVFASEGVHSNSPAALGWAFR
jgi:hypothetical protein